MKKRGAKLPKARSGYLLRIFMVNLRRYARAQYRESPNLARDLERVSGISDTSLNRWLNDPKPEAEGKIPYPTLDTIEALANAVGVPGYWLLFPGDPDLGEAARPSAGALGVAPIARRPSINR